MATEIDWGTREEAAGLYITGGYTYADVARMTGVSESQLKRWSADEGWRDKRQEYRAALADIERNTVLLRRNLLAKAMTTLDPQMIYAFAGLERATRPKVTASSATPTPLPENHREIRTPAEAVDALEGVIEMKLNRLLMSPGEITLSAVKELKQAMELTADMRSRMVPEAADTGKRGVSEASLSAIHEVLGISS